ncbi:hypothetical protein CHS0354_030060 [Potamilus streckersoni]|uniref:Uncharacterized protein n=1 Tax=Potamilus streckersoni TaxID=2493646 RepID=A0AAE0VDD9_9BIVA|nr:hypothetical protein CHS0354_030060 [Potamilus streckersoni]
MVPDIDREKCICRLPCVVPSAGYSADKRSSVDITQADGDIAGEDFIAGLCGVLRTAIVHQDGNTPPLLADIYPRCPIFAADSADIYPMGVWVWHMHTTVFPLLYLVRRLPASNTGICRCDKLFIICKEETVTALVQSNRSGIGSPNLQQSMTHSHSITRPEDTPVKMEDIRVSGKRPPGGWHPGPLNSEFEKQFAQYCGTADAVSCANGTQALHVIWAALGIKPAVPVFADINPETYNLDPNRVEDLLRQHSDIKTVLLVNLYGLPADVEAFQTLKEKYGLTIVEDCAQSHGAAYRDKRTGSLFDAAAFSFYATKNVYCGEGGCVFSATPNTHGIARKLINHGRKDGYEHDMIGYNYRMTEIQCVIGLMHCLMPMRILPARIENAVKVPHVPDGYTHVYHQYVIRAPHRDKLKAYLHDMNIQANIVYPIPNHKQEAYISHFPEMKNLSLSLAEQACQEVLSLPVQPFLTEADCKYVSDAVSDFYRTVGVIGTGYLGRFHVQKYQMCPKSELAVAKEFGCTAFSSPAELLKHTELVSIAVPSSLHYEIAKQALQSGVHTLIEKPITTKIEHADELIRLAAEKKLKIQVGHLERYNPAFVRCCLKLKIPCILNVRRANRYVRRNIDVSVLLDLMIHDVNLIQRVNPHPIVALEALGAAVLSDSFDISTVRMKFSNGSVADLRASRLAHKGERKIRIFQKNACLVIDMLNQRNMFYRKTVSQEAAGSILAEINSFIDAVRNNTEPEINGQEGRDALEITLKAIEQIQKADFYPPELD